MFIGFFFHAQLNEKHNLSRRGNKRDLGCLYKLLILISDLFQPVIMVNFEQICSKSLICQYMASFDWQACFSLEGKCSS
jgi:hypothetical protein